MSTTSPVDALFNRAKLAGIRMSAICDQAGVARSTPSRWRHDKNGANVDTVQKLDEALTTIIAKRQPESAAA